MNEEHNKNFYSLEELKRARDCYKDYQDGEEVYYFVGALRYACNEIDKLTFESTKWESKFYDEAKKVDKAIEYIKFNATSNYFDAEKNMFRREIDLLEILCGSDKE